MNSSTQSATEETDSHSSCRRLKSEKKKVRKKKRRHMDQYNLYNQTVAKKIFRQQKSLEIDKFSVYRIIEVGTISFRGKISCFFSEERTNGY
jgi:hypothetical protein